MLSRLHKANESMWGKGLRCQEEVTQCGVICNDDNKKKLTPMDSQSRIDKD